MRRIPLRSLFAVSAAALLSTSASATGDLKLTPPALIEDLVHEDLRLAQDYDEAFDAEEEEPAPAQPQKRRRNRSSSSSSSPQRSASSSSGGSGYSSFGGGGVAPMGKTFGVGLQLGAPTAVTGKFMLTPESGLVVGLGAGYGFFFDPALSLHVDYLYHPAVLFQNEGVKLSWFIGGGGWVGLFQGRRPGYNYIVPGYTYVYSSPLYLAARLPIGLSLALQSLPLEFYLEGVPALSIFPAISFGLGFAGGVRFYF